MDLVRYREPVNLIMTDAGPYEITRCAVHYRDFDLRPHWSNTCRFAGLITEEIVLCVQLRTFPLIRDKVGKTRQF